MAFGNGYDGLIQSAFHHDHLSGQFDNFGDHDCLCWPNGIDPSSGGAIKIYKFMWK